MQCSLANPLEVQTLAGPHPVCGTDPCISPQCPYPPPPPGVEGLTYRLWASSPNGISHGCVRPE